MSGARFAAMIGAYQPSGDGLTEMERMYRLQFMALLKNNPRCFWRDDFMPGHVTASTMVVNLDATKTLFLFHKKLGKWMQFGGHCDGDTDVAATALRELEEEAGLTPAMVDCDREIFDLDIHTIPARKDEPEHLHYDVRFLVRFDHRMPIPGSEENQEYRWFDLEEAEKVVTFGHGRWRLIQKTKLLQRGFDHGRA